MKQFIQKNYVFISGLLSALTLVIQQAIANHSTDWKVMGYAALVAICGFIGNQWKGKGLTVTGLIGSVAGAFVTVQESGHITVHELVLASLVAILVTMSSGLTAYKPNTA